MNVRRLTLADLDIYFQVRLDMLQTNPSAFLTTYDEEKAKGNGFFKEVLSRTDNQNVILGAFNEDGQIIGACGVYLQPRPKIQHKAYLWGMFVYPDHRGKSVGRALLHEAVEHAREEMKACGVYLSVESDNAAAKALYTNYGFKSWGIEPSAMRTGDEDFSEDHMCYLFVGQ